MEEEQAKSEELAGSDTGSDDEEKEALEIAEEDDGIANSTMSHRFAYASNKSLLWQCLPKMTPHTSLEILSLAT